MTPAEAKRYAQDLIDVHGQVNASYTSNSGIARAAEVAMVLLDMATQCEHAQLESWESRRDLIAVRKELASLQRDFEALRTVEQHGV